MLSDKDVYSVIVTQDGGYAVAGGSEYNVWLAKFAPESSVSPDDTSAFPITLVAVVVIIVGVAVVCLFVYFKKYKR